MDWRRVGRREAGRWRQFNEKKKRYNLLSKNNLISITKRKIFQRKRIGFLKREKTQINTRLLTNNPRNQRVLEHYLMARKKKKEFQSKNPVPRQDILHHA